MDIQNVIGPGQAARSDSMSDSNAAQRPAPQIQGAAEKRAEPTAQQLQQAVQTINRKLSASTALEFSVDQTTHMTVVKVMDKESGDVIRQIPSDAALAIAESVENFQKGLLLQQTV